MPVRRLGMLHAVTKGLNPNIPIVPNGGVECRVCKNRDSQRTAGFRSITGGVPTTTATLRRAVYGTDGDTSVNLCLSQPAACTTTTKRGKENRKLYLYTLSKCNTGMAALCAGLPVKTKKMHNTFFRLQPARDPRYPPYFAW